MLSRVEIIGKHKVNDSLLYVKINKWCLSTYKRIHWSI